MWLALRGRARLGGDEQDWWDRHLKLSQNFWRWSNRGMIAAGMYFSLTPTLSRQGRGFSDPRPRREGEGGG